MLDIVLSLPVFDVSRTVDFYHHVLGFELVGATGKGGVTRARVRLGTVELLFRTARSQSIGDALRLADADDRIIIHFKVDDIISLYKRARTRATLIRDLETTLFGTVEFAIEDADGIILSFSQATQNHPPSRVQGEPERTGKLF